MANARHEQVDAKLSRRGREVLNEGEEIRSPKRKVIWVESEETQDCVREGKSTEHEEDEKRTFVPSAISVPLKPLFRCDIQCSEKTLSYWQLASVVVMKAMKHTRPTCVRSVSTNTCEVEKMSIVQEIMLKSTDYLRRIMAPSGGQGGVTMPCSCPNCNSFPIERLHLVGLWVKRVLRDLWRKI